MDVISTFFLPYLSLTGPSSRMLIVNDSMNKYNDMFMTDSVVPNSMTMSGSPDRYISVEIGPNILNSTISNMSNGLDIKAHLFSIGTYSLSAEMEMYAGRMIFPPPTSSSMRCALQPTILAIANIGVNISSGMPSIS